MDAPNYTKELQTQKVRQRLNADQIKLWLPPYTDSANGKQDQGNIPEASSLLKMTTMAMTTVS